MPDLDPPGAVAATGLVLVLYPHVDEVAEDVLVPHGQADTDGG
jgi:hypothetical protein